MTTKTAILQLYVGDKTRRAKYGLRDGADITCQHCGCQNSPDARFCNGCGHRIDGVCASCGHQNDPAARFCNSCGQSLSDRGRKPGAAGSPRIRCKRLPSLPATERAGVAILLPLRPSARGRPRPHGSAVAEYGPLPRAAATCADHVSVSAGLYLLYWFYLTWKHFRDSTDRDAYPVWHAHFWSRYTLSSESMLTCEFTES